MNKATLAFALALGTLAAGTGAAEVPPRAARPYNIVLMVADDLGTDALGCYGNPVVKTPNIDQLASAGTRFSNAFCTTASCAASRSVILTGLHNHSNGTFGHTHDVHHFSLYPHIGTLPALLKNAGYRTGRVGKQHYAPEAQFPFDFSPPHYLFGRDDVAMAKACRSFIEQDEPFFLYYASWNPHPEGASGGPATWHPLKPRSFGNPQQSFPGDDEQTYRDEEVLIPPFMNDTPEARAEMAQHYQAVSRLDRGIGVLIQILKETGKYENTVILLISDNGPAFPLAKMSLHEAGMHLPCLVKGPAQGKKGVVSDALVSWVDITPTLLDYAGARIPFEDRRPLHGQSFRAILEEPSPASWREEIYASHSFHEVTTYYPMRAIRTKKYKFIWNVAHQLPFPLSSGLWNSITWQATLRDGATHFGARTVQQCLQRPAFELYDLEADPNETVNLADQPEYAALVERMQQKIRAFQQSTKDPWLHKWTCE